MARALFIEAEHDLNTAKLTKDGGEFSKTIQHSCDAVEKAAKAFLTLDGHGIIPQHKVSDFMSELLNKYPKVRMKLTKVVKHMNYLEDFSGKTKYPIRIRGKLIIPSEQFNEKEAENCLKLANEVMDQIVELAEEIFKINLVK